MMHSCILPLRATESLPASPEDFHQARQVVYTYPCERKNLMRNIAASMMIAAGDLSPCPQPLMSQTRIKLSPSTFASWSLT